MQLLQKRLSAYNDLHLTLKHLHWNVVGPNFIGVHEIAALDLVYTGVLTDLRKAVEQVGDVDPVTEDLLIGQTGELEQFQWFVRAHLENAGGELASAGASSEKEAADSARDL